MLSEILHLIRRPDTYVPQFGTGIAAKDFFHLGNYTCQTTNEEKHHEFTFTRVINNRVSK
jgi:hypothetical protein